MIEVLYGNDGKFHTYRARGVVAYSLENLAAKLGVPLDELSVQLDVAAQLRGAPKPKAQTAAGVKDFPFF